MNRATEHPAVARWFGYRSHHRASKSLAASRTTHLFNTTRYHGEGESGWNWRPLGHQRIAEAQAQAGDLTGAVESIKNAEYIDWNRVKFRAWK